MKQGKNISYLDDLDQRDQDLGRYRDGWTHPSLKDKVPYCNCRLDRKDLCLWCWMIAQKYFSTITIWVAEGNFSKDYVSYYHYRSKG